jgi:2'-5' RNA ligase
MIRTFVAVELEAEVRRAIGRLQDDMREKLKPDLKALAPQARLQWVRADSIHLTVKFLGDVEESRVEQMCRALAQVAEAMSPILLDITGVGVFPDLRAPRVLWLGLSDPAGRPGQVDTLVRVAGMVDAALSGLGFSPETRPFSPHLTLARIKEQSRGVGQALAQSDVMQHAASAGALHVRALSLMESQLRPSGAVYTRLCEAPLVKSDPF